MVSFIALLPSFLTTFLYAVAALLRFYGQLNTAPIPETGKTLADFLSFLQEYGE